MLLQSFGITGSAVIQIFILGALGYFLVKKNFLGDAGLDALSRMTIDVTLPILIFCQLISGFSFILNQNWWVFPLLSVVVTILGLGLGAVFSLFIHGREHKIQFLSSVAFQNSGYLPLALIAALLPKEVADSMFIYLFLFLLGFNLLMFSLGTYLLGFSKEKKFYLRTLFSPPVIATIIALLVVLVGFNKFIPQLILRPLKTVGDCTLPLAMLVVGGNLAQIRLGKIDIKAISLLILSKLILLPALGILFLMKLHLPALVGLLIIIELSAPPATLLSVINRSLKKEDLLIGQGIFFGHIVSLITIPVFLSLYFSLFMIK